MSERPMSPTEQLVADYVRSTMRVDPPHGLSGEIVRAVAELPQERRPIFSAFGVFTPAFAAIVVTAVLVVVGAMVLAPRNIGPGPDPVPTPAPSITSEDARILTQPGDVIRLPALDAEGQFGTITIERGGERAGYDGFVPVAFDDVFFVELYVTYRPERSTSEEFGEWEFAFAADLDGDGFDADDLLQRGVGFTGMEGQPGFDSAPQPQLEGKRFGDEVLEGWLVLELPAAAAGWDLYLVYGHGEWTDGIQNMVPDSSALLRLEGEPVGVTAFDPDAFPSPTGSPPPMPTMHALPTPLPSPAATFEPVADAEADALFAETQTCTNEEAAAIVTFPSRWHTNEAVEDIPPCTFFDSAPIDLEAALGGLGDFPPVVIRSVPAWFGGIEEPRYERLTIAGRVAWRITFSPEQQSFGTAYLIPTTDDPYGPFVHAGALTDEARAVLERILVRLEFIE